MYSVILVIHTIICMVLIGLVLLQRGKGADMGAAFGSGASQTVFGSQGSDSFLLKLVGMLAAGFFATSLILGALAVRQVKQQQPINFSEVQQSVPSVPVQSKQTEGTEAQSS